ncbi:MAG TPA: Type 1 glutamine amidotransferase-like domain-containing protein [Patescibacteria group bacterium]|nr:Type 1 glutamine amidotransferase-like domain-containing protein [Patescibacteria group bacterium]
MKRNPADIFLVAGNPDGGRQGSDPLLARILSMTGLTRPTVAYVGAASHDNRMFFLWIASLLKRAGAGSVRLAALASPRADPAKALRLLQEADLVFVSGGDVEAGMRVLERTGLTILFRELHQSGKPFIGLSAGSIMLARSWVRWTDAADDSTAEPFPCLNLAPLLCDTHAEKEGWEELKVLLKLTGAALGFAIPAGAALHVSSDGSKAALGKPVHLISQKLGSGLDFDVKELKS